jgi:arylsulfatase A-like enzyme
VSWLKSRGAVAVAILALIALYIGTVTEVYVDPRPDGTLEDLRALAGRDDVNVLFILVDTLRADRLGIHGYERDTSPGLDYLAESGVRFARHRAQSSWTKASMASLWTGLYPARTKVLRYPDAVSPEARTPAEILQEAGFVTGGIWRNGWVAPNFGFQQGFDLYQKPHVRQAPAELRREARAGRIDGTDIDLVFSAIEFLRVHRDQRFMLYLHLMDVHQYVSVEELAIFGTDYSDAYDNSILWVDRQIRELIRALEDLDLRERTLVVVASDHGEAFGEHGREGHARDVYTEVTHTPFILSLPFILEPGVVVEAGSQNVDVWPTILDLLGLSPLEQADGRSLLPEILGEANGSRPDEDIAQLDGTWGQVAKDPLPIVAIREGDYRLVHRIDDSRPDELYDLSTDPGERESIAADRPEVAARLRERARRHYELPGAWSSAPTVELNEMDLGQLRALGYAIE